MKVCVVEFAGIKFKAGNVKSGKEYIQYVQRFLGSVVHHAPTVSKVVVCEEKYSFTPDDFKASTRQQRKSKKETDVNHLKGNASTLSEQVFNKDVITKTEYGKRLISMYLAENRQSLCFSKNFDLVIDSEFCTSQCDCAGSCDCLKYCIPQSISYSSEKNKDMGTCFHIDSVHQRKGEAEMAIVDWLINLQDELNDDEAAVSIVTSGDIDAVYIHLYAISKYWCRGADGKFLKPAYVILQKPRSKYDIYNITAILEVLESKFQDDSIGMKIAISLCLGGNDFIPKCHQISHDTNLKAVIKNQQYRDNLFQMNGTEVWVDKDLFVNLFKTLFCPKKHLGSNINFDEVRALSISRTVDNSEKSGYKTADPRKWLPPKSAVERLADFLQLQIDYLETVGIHDSPLPCFLKSPCLRKNTCGEIEYDFGPDAHFSGVNELLEFTAVKRPKRLLNNTPQNGARRKRLLTSTPKQK